MLQVLHAHVNTQNNSIAINMHGNHSSDQSEVTTDCSTKHVNNSYLSSSDEEENYPRVIALPYNKIMTNVSTCQQINYQMLARKTLVFFKTLKTYVIKTEKDRL